jgi:hypothetical protein
VVSLPGVYLHEPMLDTDWTLGKFSDPAGFARLCGAANPTRLALEESIVANPRNRATVAPLNFCLFDGELAEQFSILRSKLSIFFPQRMERLQ